jgi:hypothetical protein
MSFVSVAVGVVGEGIAANMLAGAMMGATVKVGTNVVSGKGAFDDVGRSIVMGGLTGGIAPGVSEALGVSAPMGAAITSGGITTLATGSLSRGLAAGMGAYGMYGLADSISGMGANSLTSQYLGDYQGALTAQGYTPGTPEFGEAARNMVTDARSAMPLGDKMSAGLDAVKANPGAFLKDNFKYLAAASAPIMADAMIPTTTKAPLPQTNSTIREKRWNGRYFEDVANTDANVFNTSGRSFSDFYRGYKGGGIVALAGGGFTQDQINAALKTELAARGGTSQADLTAYAKSQYGLTDAQINAAYDTIPGFNAQGKYDAQDYMDTHVAGQTSPQMVVDAAAAANPYSAQNMAKVDTTRQGQYVTDPATGQPVALSAYSPGFNANNQETLLRLGELAAGGGQDTTSLAFNKVATPEQKTEAARLWTAEKARLDAIDAANAVKAPTGLANLNQNQNLLVNQNLTNQNANAGLTALADGKSQTYKWFEERGLGFTPIDKVIDNWFDEYTDDLALLPPDRQEKVMKDALNTENMNEADLIKATGKTIKDWIQIKTGNIKDVTSTYLPGGVGGGGNTVRNDNGTITTTPDIPGRPDDGFTGMKNVRDVYTEGGGNLGYTSPSFDKIEDFNKKYVTDRMSGDSLAAYEYLTGKKGAAYPVKSGVGQIARPYDEAVLGYPTRGNLPYTYNKTTGKMDVNPDYVAPGRDAKGNVTYSMSLNDIKAALTKTPLTGQALYDWAKSNNLTAQQIADATDRSLSSVYADFRAGAKAKADVTNADGTVDETKVAEKALADEKEYFDEAAYLAKYPDVKREIETGKSASGQPSQFKTGYEHYLQYGKGSTTHAPIFKAGYTPPVAKAKGGIMGYAMGGMPGYALGGLGSLGGYSDGGRLLKGPGDGVSDSIPATIGRKQQPARLADGEFVVPCTYRV